MIHLLHLVGLRIHLTHHVEQMKKSQRISARGSIKFGIYVSSKRLLDWKKVRSSMRWPCATLIVASLLRVKVCGTSATASPPLPSSGSSLTWRAGRPTPPPTFSLKVSLESGGAAVGRVQATHFEGAGAAAAARWRWVS